ncbi:Putative Transcription elongation factor S-II [Rhizopus microsporus]|nr:Putative Transcription elongation factor S-II [Rhizopus microsporus]
MNKFIFIACLRVKQACLDILNNLSKIKATGDLLKRTEIGKVVGKLRTHKDNQLSIKAKAIVKKWKDDVVQQSTSNNPNTKKPTIQSPPADTVSVASTEASRASSQTSSPKTPSNEGVARTIKSDEVTYKSTGNVPRNKTIELMYAAIGFNSGADSDLLLKRSLAIESRIFQEYGDVNEGYKGKVRTLANNLKNKSNPGLRESVVSGELTIEKLCTMSVEEMASEEAQARDRKLAEEALFKARGATSAQAETDMFKCGKCQGRKCTYFQMQTRSADEPMTTFVTCVNCGNHWKFC